MDCGEEGTTIHLSEMNSSYKLDEPLNNSNYYLIFQKYYKYFKINPKR